LNIASLDDRFAALMGYTPYIWQRRLYECFVAGEKYGALDLPTGLGKTSIIPVWLLARAAGARLPRRLVYVVDRRAVVDQATAVADRIAKQLCPLATGVAAELREALGLTGDATLPVSTLRGQHADNRRWLENPGGTAIVVGTVDMIGSRLLFEGYGVSRGMRPVHAGLLGVDSLIVIDEAHLVPPFEALVRQVSAMGDDDWGNAPERLASSLQLMSLSATGRERAGVTVFRLTEEDREDPPVRARLQAPKRLRLLPEATPNTLVERLSETAWAYGEGGRRVVVFCNSRKTAQAVEADLDARVKKDKDRFARGAKLTELLVGERRYRERVSLTGDQDLKIAASPVFARFAPGAAPDAEGRPAFLVATSAGEVGVDLDADDLVCDLVAWERMVQRLGRVNRRPNPGESKVAVIPVAKEKEAEDDISDEALKRLRAPFESPFWPDGDDGAKDASPASLRDLKQLPALAAILQAASTPEPLRPSLTRPTVLSWSLTALDQHTGRPKVQPWLRGWAKSEPQTSVIWRRLFPLRPLGEFGAASRDLKAFFESAAPPHISESLSAPSWRVAQVLRECAGAFQKASLKTRSATTVDVGPSDDESDGPPKHRPVVVVLSADRSVDDLYSVERLAEADVETFARSIANGTVVVDARLRGLDENGLLDAKAKSEPVTIDIQPAALWSLPLDTTSGRRITFGDRPAKEQFWKLDEFRWAESDSDDAGGLWVEVWRGPGDNPGDPAVSKHVQGLSVHHSHTGRHAGRIAKSLGLLSPWRDVLIAAAEAHDLGKDRPLWQNAMNARRDDGRPYAKTEGGGDGRALNGYRHEFGSLRDVLASPEAYLPPVVTEDPDRRDLALHLVLAHHGWARPSIKAYDPDLLPSQSPAIAQAAALRFAKLQARWGAWGLAWWESLLRAADWAASRELNEQPEANTAFAPAMEPADG
jgi:CRISPR-associated endonuclease/helicase Cas3